MTRLSARLEAARRTLKRAIDPRYGLPVEAALAFGDLLGSLQRQAESYEDLADGFRAYQMAQRIAALEEGLDPRRQRIDAALAAKGLSAKVVPASALLTEAHLRGGKVELFPRAWSLTRSAGAGSASPRGGEEGARP